MRIGLGYYQRKTVGGLFFEEGEKSDTLWVLYGSLDWRIGRFTLRSEYYKGESTFAMGPFFYDEFWRSDFYVELGLRVSDKFHIWGMYDQLQIEFTDTAQFTRPNQFDLRIAVGVSLNYFFAPNLVLKGEYHQTEEEGLSTVAPIFTPEGLRFEPIHWNADDGDCLIISLSVSF